MTTDGLPTGSEREARREYLARKMKELADATRKASKLLPDRPITGEVVACAGIMAMANLLDEVSSVLAASPPEAENGTCCPVCGDRTTIGIPCGPRALGAPPEASREPETCCSVCGDRTTIGIPCAPRASRTPMPEKTGEPMPPVEPEG